MNVRDFLFNFCDPTMKICIQKVVTEQILFTEEPIVLIVSKFSIK